MTLAAPIDLSAWFETHVGDYLGLTPTSTSPQPVHVLNGLMHAALSGRRAPRAAVDFVATKAGGDWAVGNASLRKKTPLTIPPDDVRLDKARRAVSSLIAADRAVFSSFASFQLAHPGLVTSDRTHLHLGSLAARLLLSNENGQTSLAALVERLSRPQPNPQWAIEAVLSEPGIVDEFNVTAMKPSVWWGDAPEGLALAKWLGAALERATKLALVAADSLLPLEVLAVTATWTGLIVYSQVPSLELQQGLTPLLCEAGEPGELASIRLASAATLDRLDGNFRQWIADRILHDMKWRFRGNVPDGDHAIKYVNEAHVKKLSGGAMLTRAQVEDVYHAWRADESAEQALARTLQEALTAAMGNKARDWFAAVGRHSGFVGPRRGHPARLRAEVALVPSLLLAGMNDDDPAAIPFSEWEERMASRFGILFGPNPLSRSMKPGASEEDLERNRTAMASLFGSLGLARQYSDGVTELLNPFETWTKR